MMYKGLKARKICIESLASLNEDGRYPKHEGDKGYFQNPDGVWSAFDNSTGDCFCEDFKTEQQAIDWCEGKFEVSDEEPKTLEEMLSDHAYNEIVEKLKNEVGENAFKFIFNAVKEALEKGSVKAKEDILIGWLDVDSMRVCSHCGAIMEEGWYLDCQGYACSDECAMKIMDVPDMEHFHRYRIYKEDIDSYLEDEGLGRKEEDLTQEEIEEIIDDVSDGIDACYTQWF